MIKKNAIINADEIVLKASGEKLIEKINQKQDSIEDLDTIRSNASDGAMALQKIDEIGGGAIGDHNHDDLYYTKTEVDSKLETKAAASHTHDEYLTSIPEASVSTLGGIKMSYGTEDLTAGTSPLSTGSLYFVYE